MPGRRAVSRRCGITLFAVGAMVGCGGSGDASSGEAISSAAMQSTSGGSAPSAMMEAPEPYAEESWAEDDSLALDSEASAPTARASASAARGAPRAPQIAQAAPPVGANAVAQAATTNTAAPRTATDAVSPNAPLLIYTAELHVAVYEVTETQEAILSAVGELDGFLSQRSDSHLVVRVPAQRFQEALAAVEAAGDVVSRNVQATDVSEEFRDLSIRIRNAEAMRERLEQLLNRAANVQEALAIERELQRLTETIERMKGRQRFLSDRIAFSTITIRFQSRATDPGPSDDFQLPFDWLSELGVTRLLDL